MKLSLGLTRGVPLLLLLTAGCGGGDGQSCSGDPGIICPWAGTGKAGFDGDGHSLEDSRFYWPVDLTFTRDGHAYILDWNNHRVRVLGADGNLKTVIGTDFVGDGPDDKSDLTPPGAPGTSVTLNHPTQILEMPGASTLVLVSWHNHKLRTYDPATGLVVVSCGTKAGAAVDGPLATAFLNQPAAATYGPDGMLYVLDQRNQRIRKIDVLAPTGTITTVVGTGVQGFAGDASSAAPLPPLMAQVSFPPGSNPPPAGSLKFGADGKLYFSDILNNRIRRVDFAASTIDTIYGDGTPAMLNNPRDVEFGPDGRLYVADEKNNRVLALTVTGPVATVAVIAGTGVAGNTGDGGLASAATLNRPAGLAFDSAGFLYIVDTLNSRIRRIRMGAAR